MVEGMGQLTRQERIADENKDKKILKKFKGVSEMETKSEVIDFIWKILKKDDRKNDAISFMGDLKDCRSLEKLKELADWHLKKPKLGARK